MAAPAPPVPTPPAARPPTATPPVASKPTASATPAIPPTPTGIPRTGDIEDRGIVRRDSLHALSWRVRGAAKIQGDADVGTAWIEGSGVIAGKLVADAFHGDGTLEVEGAIDVKGTLEVDGTLRAAAAVHAGAASIKGTVRCAGDFVVDRILRVRGVLAAPSLRAGALDFVGAMEVPGDVTASTLSAEFPHSSRLGAIRGRSVRIRGKIQNAVEKILAHRTTVHVERIEADAVELEAVDVEFIRSPSIVLGRNCHVTLVEGTIVRQHRSSQLGPRSESPPPHGLRR